MRNLPLGLSGRERLNELPPFGNGLQFLRSQNILQKQLGFLFTLHGSKEPMKIRKMGARSRHNSEYTLPFPLALSPKSESLSPTF